MNYDNTHFYKIVYKDLNIQDCYVGHTTNFKQRKNHHKTSCLNINAVHHHYPVYKFIRENGGSKYMVLIETIECKNRLDAGRIERQHIEKLNATLNKLMPGQTMEEKNNIAINGI